MHNGWQRGLSYSFFKQPNWLLRSVLQLYWLKIVINLDPEAKGGGDGCWEGLRVREWAWKEKFLFWVVTTKMLSGGYVSKPKMYLVLANITTSFTLECIFSHCQKSNDWQAYPNIPPGTFWHLPVSSFFKLLDWCFSIEHIPLQCVFWAEQLLETYLGTKEFYQAG